LFKLQSFKGLFVEQKIAKNKFVLCFRKCGLQQQGKLINSYLSGPRDIPLIKLTLGQLLQQAADSSRFYPSRYQKDVSSSVG
jgi:hypothetical protein